MTKKEAMRLTRLGADIRIRVKGELEPAWFNDSADFVIGHEDNPQPAPESCDYVSVTQH